LILVVYAAVQRDRRVVTHSFWWPGIVAYCAVVLPWFVAVQVRNPEFFRVFILEHNFARFGTNLYRHHQPLWYYLPVAALALLPWVAIVLAAVVETIRAWIAESCGIFKSEEAWDVFLLLWFVIPVLFFSVSQSKLPGYILPAVPAATLLAASYVWRRECVGESLSTGLLIPHSLLAASLLVPAVLIQYILKVHHIVWGSVTAVVVAVACVFAALLFLVLRTRAGVRLLHVVTLVPVVLAASAVLRFAGPALDDATSTRPLAAQLAQTSSTLPVAVLHARREVEYGLHFYRNRPVLRYENGQVPAEEHLLVASEEARRDVIRILGPRQAFYLGNNADLHVDSFRVVAAK
jgi:4-amino-4-deoxy-L-arabinose transferase-like glycosyltransferase